MYCENCRVVFEGTECPHCGNEKGRPPEADDDIFLVEKEVLYGEMLADVFKQKGIPHYFKPRLGAGMAMTVGLYQESYRFYVPYAHWADALEALEELFPADAED